MDAASATRDLLDRDGPRLFLCYRRKDTRYVAGQIYRRLTQEFGQTNVFKDVDNIPLGHDFRQVLDERVGDCTVFLAVIGTDWLDARDPAGKRALDDANDFVRLEIEAALRREIAVIPVLVDDAVIPPASALPASLADLSYRQGVPVRPDPDFDRDLDRLVKGIRLAVKDREARAARQQREARQREAARLEEQRRSTEDARAEQARRADEAKRAEDAKRAEEASRAEEVRRARRAEEARRARRAEEAQRAEEERARRAAQASAAAENARASSIPEDQVAASEQVVVKQPLSRMVWVAAGLSVLLVLLITVPWSSTPPPQSQIERSSDPGTKPQTSTVTPQPPAVTPAPVDPRPGPVTDREPAPASPFRLPTFRRAWSLGDSRPQPTSITVDASGNVHVGLVNARSIQVFDAGGRLLRTIVPEVEGSTGFVGPLDVDSGGNTFVSWRSLARQDGSNLEFMLLLNPDGTIRHTWGGPEGGANGRFNKIGGVAVDSAGAVYVADNWNHRIQVFDSRGKFLRSWGKRSAADGDFRGPSGLAISPAGDVFVADTDNHRIQVFSRAGKFLHKWGTKGRAEGELNSPLDVAVAADGIVYVADFYNNRIQAFDAKGTFLGKWGARGKGDGQFDFPHCLATSGADTVYVCDRENSRIQVFSR